MEENDLEGSTCHQRVAKETEIITANFFNLLKQDHPTYPKVFQILRWHKKLFWICCLMFIIANILILESSLVP